jgi:hypothetical protein
MQGFRDLPPLDPSFLLASQTTSPPSQEAGLEIQPSFPRTPRLLQIPMPRLPKTPGKTCDTALLLAITRFSQVKLVVNLFPDAEELVQFFPWFVVITNRTPWARHETIQTHSATQTASRHSEFGATSFAGTSRPFCPVHANLIRSAIDCPSCNQCPQTARLTSQERC